MSTPLLQEKQARRAHMRALLAAITPEEVARRSLLVCERLSAWARATTTPPRCVMVYAAIPAWGEVDLGASIDAWLADGVTVCVPRIDWHTHAMTPVPILARQRDLVPDSRGIPGPRADLPGIDPHALELVVVPGLAFDTRGGRLGRGKGHYDRFLASLPPVRTIGAMFDEQLVDSVPMEAHDLRLGTLLTDRRMVDVGAAPHA